MTEPRFPDQARYLDGLLKRSHLTAAQLADRTGVKIKTVEKYLAGYQPAGKRLLGQFEQIADWEEKRLAEAMGKAKPPEDLHATVVQYVGKMLEPPPGKRELAQKLIDALGETAAPPPPPPQPPPAEKHRYTERASDRLVLNEGDKEKKKLHSH